MLPASPTAIPPNSTASPATSSANSTNANTTATPRVRSLSKPDDARSSLLSTMSIRDRYLQAVADGDTDAARELIRRGVPVDQTDADGKTALAIAARNGDIAMMRALLSMGANVDGSYRNVVHQLSGRARVPDDVPFVLGALGYIAATLGSVTVGVAVGAIGLFAIHLASRNTINCDTPLIMAARHGQTDAVRVLLKAGATVDFTDASRHTALERAAEHGRTEAVGVLLAAGAKVDHSACYSTSRDGGESINDGTALILAARNGHVETLRALLEAGADVHLTDGKGCTALKIATVNGHTAAAQILLESVAKSKGLGRPG